ncbi:methyl-accepting chemotaxis protein [Marinagarivorans algicola]|uniref:methyl-accepting chemotaxis protein n=1 Tax=Marinagarivorans algicola TaxID=1513270 RepID=UPI0006B60AEF|nr:methyl-accepting chemotaxis protein [Marinagarivorans algicola]
MNAIKKFLNGNKASSNITFALHQSQGVIELDMSSGRIKTVNSFFCNLLGVPASQLMGVMLDELCANTELSAYIALQSRVETASNNAKIMACLSCGEYNPVWIWLHFVLVKNDFGDVEGIVVFAHNADSDKKNIDENNKYSTYASALNACQVGIILADHSFDVVYVNNSLKAMFVGHEYNINSVIPNFNVEEIIGSNVNIFYGNIDLKCTLLKDLKEPRVVDFKLGNLIFSVTASPWIENDVCLGTVFELYNKTQQVDAENKLAAIAQENFRIRQALDVCDTSVMLADQDLKIIYLNKAVSQMLHARQQQIQAVIPCFNSNDLLGVCVDEFHQSPDHQRQFLATLTVPYKTDLSLGELVFGLAVTPLFDSDGLRIGTVVEWKDKTQEIADRKKEQNTAQENTRVKQALDTVSASVMIADGDANIIYMNDSSVAMMKNAEADLARVLKGFNASELLGKNIDMFHQRPEHQRHLIANITSTYKGKAEVAGRSFSVIANPILVNGERLGTVVEWEDKTAEKNIEKEIDTMLEAALEGDFTKQLTLADKEGFLADVSKGLNTLVSTIEISLNDVLRMLGAMAKGDLSERVTRNYQGAFGQLKDNANTTADKLSEIIGDIRMSSSEITRAANEISVGNADLSQRTEEQASSLEETASSMEEMTSTLRQSSIHTQAVSRFSGEVKEKAAAGGAVVSKAVKAMEAINTSSKKISDIISVIDEIAFQTNLLALNAAVEAARAGEQGRGFAVVAGEVRNLAQRSAGAAKEIKALIRDSVVKVEDGRALVHASGDTLSEIVESVEKVSHMMGEMADAAVEQASGIEQVNTAISQMDEMTQQNAALVEEASAAAQAMADQARAMNTVVDFFSEDGGSGLRPDDTIPLMGQSVYQHNSAATLGRDAAGLNTFTSINDDDWEEF